MQLYSPNLPGANLRSAETRRKYIHNRTGMLRHHMVSNCLPDSTGDSCLAMTREWDATTTTSILHTPKKKMDDFLVSPLDQCQGRSLPNP